MAKSGDETVFDQYVRHADLLRNWFVGYGIGAVVLFVSGQSVLSTFPQGEIVMIAKWFILGIISQVLLAFINKLYNFQLYLRTFKTGAASAGDVKRVKRSFYWIDVPLDVLTFGSFCRATFLLLAAFG